MFEKFNDKAHKNIKSFNGDKAKFTKLRKAIGDQMQRRRPWVRRLLEWARNQQKLKTKSLFNELHSCLLSYVGSGGFGICQEGSNENTQGRMHTSEVGLTFFPNIRNS